jgi:hypothetical protein
MPYTYKQQVAFCFDKNKQYGHTVLEVYKNKMYVLIFVTSEETVGHTCQWCNKLRNTILWGSYGYSDDTMSGVYNIFMLTLSSCMFGCKMV